MSYHPEEWNEDDRKSMNMLFNHPIKLHWMMVIADLKSAARNFRGMISFAWWLGKRKITRRLGLGS
jgi:hypothetical protein